MIRPTSLIVRNREAMSIVGTRTKLGVCCARRDQTWLDSTSRNVMLRTGKRVRPRATKIPKPKIANHAMRRRTRDTSVSYLNLSLYILRRAVSPKSDKLFAWLCNMKPVSWNERT